MINDHLNLEAKPSQPMPPFGWIFVVTFKVLAALAIMGLPTWFIIEILYYNATK
jgi:hypothetical protein